MGERKRRLAAGQPLAAAFDGKLLARAFEALHAADRRTAERAFEALQARLPTDPDAVHAIGVLGLQVGRDDRAAELLARAVELDPRQPTYRCHLALAHRRLGKRELARAELEAALALNPALAEAHSNLGTVLLECGDDESARRSFERALAIRPDFPDALNGLGGTDLASGRHEEACASFERAIALDPGFHEAWYNLARACARRALSREATDAAGHEASTVAANAQRALESILSALQMHRDNPAYWTQFEECVRSFDLQYPADPRVRDTLLRALDHPAVDPARLVRPIVSLATTHPSASAIACKLSGPEAFDAHAWAGLAQDVRNVLGDALLQRLLEDVVIPNAFIQRLIGCARRALLTEMLDRPSARPSLPLPLIAALAHQSFNTEYVNDESTAERASVERLRGVIAAARASGMPPPLEAYAIYACYRPLHTLEAADELAPELLPTALRALAARQILEPLEERCLRPTIAALTAVADGVSAAVRDQYEANPYPRWLRLRRDGAETSVASFLRRRFPHADLDGIPDAPARILVAGCGTGRHPASTAQRFPDARVLAVDLSLASLAYAARRTRELGIANVEYRQADILALGALTERFDVVECAGVLHHLKDPAAGWRTLCALLRPGGVMRIGLYSAIARRHVARARELVAAEGFAPTPDGIRACRAAILSRQEDPLLARVARGEDFYSLSGCRDLVFHVQERNYTLPEIAALLDELDLACLGFDLPDAVTAKYREQFPDDRGLADLLNWHRFETRDPDTFAQMYQFWVRART